MIEKGRGGLAIQAGSADPVAKRSEFNTRGLSNCEIRLCRSVRSLFVQQVIEMRDIFLEDAQHIANAIAAGAMGVGAQQRSHGHF